MATMLKPKVKRISHHDPHIKYLGEEPEFKNIEKLTKEEYLRQTLLAIKWYNYFYDKKAAQEYFAVWIHNRYPKRPELPELIRACSADRIANISAWLYPMEQRGWKIRTFVLKKVIQNLKDIKKRGQTELDEQRAKEASKARVQSAPVITIQDRTREQALRMADDIETAIDTWQRDADNFDPKEFKVVSALRGVGCKAAHARYIKDFYARQQEEFDLAVIGSDEQIKEAYGHYGKKNLKKIAEFMSSVMTACDQIIGEAKVLKKPRKKKAKPAEDLVKKLKFKTSDDGLGISSVPPTQIIGANIVVVYNTKTRKLGTYYAKTPSMSGRDGGGLSVKSASIIDFDEKTSVQKTLRKPADQLKKIKDLNTTKKFENWYSKEVKTTETKLNGRFNNDIIIVKVYK